MIASILESTRFIDMHGDGHSHLESSGFIDARVRDDALFIDSHLRHTEETYFIRKNPDVTGLSSSLGIEESLIEDERVAMFFVARFYDTCRS